MQTIRVSATKVQNDFFNILEQVMAGIEVIIEKDKKDIAVLRPKKPDTQIATLLKASKRVHGILRDESFNTEDNPLRRKGAADFLGKWDKNL